MKPEPLRKVVLIVEDEPLLRMLAVDMVEDEGFDAIEAIDADEAVRILESRDDIAIVLTDINMPGSMDGMKLASAIRDRWPPIHIIVMSGQVKDRELILPTGALFFRKPYDAKQVGAQLRRLAGGI